MEPQLKAHFIKHRPTVLIGLDGPVDEINEYIEKFKETYSEYSPFVILNENGMAVVGRERHAVRSVR